MMINVTNTFVVIIAIFAVFTQLFLSVFKNPLKQLDYDFLIWIQKYSLERYAYQFIEKGIKNHLELIENAYIIDIDNGDEEKMREFVNDVKLGIVFRHFMEKNGLSLYISRMETLGIKSIRDALYMFDVFPTEFSSAGEHTLISLFANVPRDPNHLSEFNQALWNEIAVINKLPSSGFTLSAMFFMTTMFIVSWMILLWIWKITPIMLDRHAIISLLMGKYLHPNCCQAIFHWKEPVYVGNSVTFIVKIYALVELGGTSPDQANIAHCQFTPRQSGLYLISVKLGKFHIRGSPFLKTFLPGPCDPCKIEVLQNCSSIVTAAGIPFHIIIEPRDQYYNVCQVSVGDEEAEVKKYYTILSGVERNNVDSSSFVFYDRITKRINIEMLISQFGCYSAKISYKKQNISRGQFEIIVLTDDESHKVQKIVRSNKHEGSEAFFLGTSGVLNSKPKKVFCIVTPKLFIIKEYFLKLISKRLFTFRLCPSTKFVSLGNDCERGLPAFIVNDSCQPTVTLSSKDRNVIIAILTQFMLKNIGGSETFKDKQGHFYHEIRRYHSKRMHGRVCLTVKRDKLLESSMQATKGFSLSMWCKNFEITFEGEEGVDWGGLKKEWFELLCFSLFESNSCGLFKSLSESQGALVHPNPYRPTGIKLRHYEFAGKVVGKCLYDSSLGGSYKQVVRARFTKSFLAQLIGLKVHYKHFAYDDPELYSGKVLHILEHGVDDLDLYFVDEVLLPNGQCKVVDLVADGSNKKVTNSNRLEYLNCLAQFRMQSQVTQEIEAFLSGLNELIPDSFLCMFDESELELLICGIEEYNLADFKANHTIIGTNQDFQKIISWFWSAVSNFTEEEMARLLQFTTGCSRLPPGGFSQLVPPFQIAPSFKYGGLPTAHTCFNQLALPDYDSYEQFEKALLLAIKEGSEGFGLI